MLSSESHSAVNAAQQGHNVTVAQYRTPVSVFVFGSVGWGFVFKC